MPKFLFKTNCPICLDSEIIQWTHSNCGGDQYIDENCDLICEKCNDRTFILDQTFKCNNLNHKCYNEPDAHNVIAILSDLRNIPELDSYTRRNMLKLLIKYI